MPKTPRSARKLGPTALHESILVCRYPGDGATMEVPFHALWDFQVRTVSSGTGKRTGRPFLCARMSGTSIPRAAWFGHSGAHSDGSPDMLVCITRAGNPHMYRNLRSLGENCERGETRSSPAPFEAGLETRMTAG
jgi:hypothetical protein